MQSRAAEPKRKRGRERIKEIQVIRIGDWGTMKVAVVAKDTRSKARALNSKKLRRKRNDTNTKV